MAQSLITPTEYTRIPLAVLHTNVKFAKAVDRSYATLFGKDSVALAGKIGPTLSIRLPVKYATRTGAAMSVQAVQESSVALTVGTQRGIDHQFTDQELTLTVTDWERRYGEPAGKTLSSWIDYDTAQNYSGIYNAVVAAVDTAANTAKTVLQAKQKLAEGNAPVDADISLVIPPNAETAFASQYISLYNPQPNISNIFNEGVMSTAQGMKWYMDQTMPILKTGTRPDSGITCGTTITAEGQAYIVIAGGGNAKTYNVGEVFTIAGTNSVNPETKVDTGSLQCFVIAAMPSTGSAGAGTYTAASGTTPGYYTTSSGGACAIYFSPAVYSSTSGALQNVTVMPTSTKTFTILGTTSNSTDHYYSQLVCLHKDAIALAAVELDLWRGMDMASRASYDGLSLRFMRGADIANGRLLSRWDSLYGSAVVRPELACRIYLAI
jgi:hypothetical protein